MKYLGVLSATAAVLMFGTAALAQDTQECPGRELTEAGKFTAIVRSAGFIVGARWGDGVLILNNGETRNFSLVGAKLMEVGTAEIELSGTVYNLDKVEDFPGTFLGIGGGLTAVTTDLGGMSITNGACVVLNASHKNGEGLRASMPVAPGGVEIGFDG